MNGLHVPFQVVFTGRRKSEALRHVSSSVSSLGFGVFRRKEPPPSETPSPTIANVIHRFCRCDKPIHLLVLSPSSCALSGVTVKIANASCFSISFYPVSAILGEYPASLRTIPWLWTLRPFRSCHRSCATTSIMKCCFGMTRSSLSLAAFSDDTPADTPAHRSTHANGWLSHLHASSCGARRMAFCSPSTPSRFWTPGMGLQTPHQARRSAPF